MNDEFREPSLGEAAEDQEWRQRTSGLAREIEPERDLWPSIANRIAAPRHEEVHQAAPPRSGWREAWRSFIAAWNVRGLAVQAAAALLFMSLGAGLARLGVDAPNVEAPAAGEPPSAIEAEEATLVAEASFAAAEAQYLRAKESLWLLVMSRRDQLSPVTLRVIERNLGIIDDAIRDLRRALDADPGNQQLESLLLDQHRRGIQLLQKLAEPSV